MRSNTAKKLRDFIKKFYPDRVGDKGFERVVKRVYMRGNISNL